MGNYVCGSIATLTMSCVDDFIVGGWTSKLSWGSPGPAWTQSRGESRGGRGWADSEEEGGRDTGWENVWQ